MLDNINNFCYLGIVFSCTGKWSRAQTMLADHGVKADFGLNRRTYHLFDPQPSFLCNIFDKLVTPILMYASEIWGFHHAEAVEKVHLQ